MTLDFRLVTWAEIYRIEKLFIEVYDKKQEIDYWKWLFEGPKDHVAAGVFNNNKLIGFCLTLIDGDCATAYSAMIHPEYRKRGLFQLLATFLYTESKLRGAKYICLFANENIYQIYIKHLGFVLDKQIKEYRIKYAKIKVNQFIEYYSLYFNEFMIWRYSQHPLHQGDDTRYMFYYNQITTDYMVFSVYEDRVQIIDYTNLDDAIGVGMFIAYLLQKNELAFWSELELDYPFVLLPTWRMFKKLSNINLGQVIKNAKIRMGQSDVF